VELQVDEHERFEAGTEAGHRLADALRHRTHPAVLAGEQRDDAVGLTQFLGAQDDGLVPVQAAHRAILALPADNRVSDPPEGHNGPAGRHPGSAEMR
jgi:hypothetical protein